MLFGTVPFSALATDGEPLPSPSPSPSAQPETVDESSPSPSPSAQAEELQPELLTQQSNNAADIAAALAADGYYESEGDVTLDADLTIPAGTGVKVYGSLTVPDGVTLTVKGTLDIDSTGTVTIAAGGRLVHEDSSTGGGVQVYGILYVSEVPGSYSTTSYISLGSTGSIGGVAYEDIYCTHFIYNEAELLSALNAAWGMNNLVISDDVVITQDVVLHEHSFLNVVEGSTLTVAEGARLENNTGIWIGTGAYLIVNGTIANNGDIEEM